MKLGIMQPYFFPYVGYFNLIKSVDKFVFFDTPQYKRHSWINRNRIIKLNGGSTYITVPILKSPQNTPIKDIRIDNSKNWQDKILAQINVYRKRAVCFNEVSELVKNIIETKIELLSELCILSIKSVCKYLDLPLKSDIFSKMNLDIPKDCEADEWAFNITRAMGFETYINSPNGISFFDKSKYVSAGINLKFIQPNLVEYNQNTNCFESGLSIIDVMMFNSKERILEIFNNFELVNGD